LTDITDSLLGPLIIVVVDILAFLLVGTLGRRSKGQGVKYEPFAGGEKSVPARGLYQSSLFVFAALFLVVETFALILAGSFEATSSFYPLLFLAGGGSVVTITIYWFMSAGGGTF
jgi:NADH:ubiquinone oxidoreductase subunit 3 (subunit A)